MSWWNRQYIWMIKFYLTGLLKKILVLRRKLHRRFVGFFNKLALRLGLIFNKDFFGSSKSVFDFPKIPFFINPAYDLFEFRVWLCSDQLSLCSNLPCLRLTLSGSLCCRSERLKGYGFSWVLASVEWPRLGSILLKYSSLLYFSS